MRAPLVTNVPWAIISLSLFAGAFNVEIFRSGIEAVPRTTSRPRKRSATRGCKAYCVSSSRSRSASACRRSTTISSTCVKTTTLAYAIAVPEMLYAVKQIWSERANVPEMMNVLLIDLRLLVGLLVWVMHRWERALRIPGFAR